MNTEPTAIKPPKIKKTQNYDKFNLIDWNRSIHKNNVDSLVNENKKEFKMHLFPIVVDSDLNIIDGQHRFTACMENEWPVYYIEKENVEEYYEEITSVNRAGRKHTMLDKFEMVRKKGEVSAERIYNCYLSLKGFYTLSTVIKMLTAKGTGGGLQYDLDRGVVKLHRNYPDIFNSMVLIKENGNKDYSRDGFMLSLKDVSTESNIQIGDLVSKILKTGVVVRVGMSREFLRESIKKAWNLNRKRNRIAGV